MIPKTIKVLNNNLPDDPGVYLMKDAGGEIIYVGKAGSLKRRVSSYFLKAHDNRIARLVSEIRVIDYIETPTVIEALILESELIKKYEPKFNIKDKDNKSFLYVVITKEEYPRVLLVRGTELKKISASAKGTDASSGAKGGSASGGKRIFGPFVSASSIRAALGILRRIFPWNNHLPGEIGKAKRPCFNCQIGLCPGTCLGAISKKDYARIIKNLILFLAGKKIRIIKNLKLELSRLSDAKKFEAAAKVRDMIFNLEHIYDTALITKSDLPAPLLPKEGIATMSPPSDLQSERAQDARARGGQLAIDFYGRIEGYDISNISGTSAVGSMVVFVNGIPEKSEYRKFKIKTVSGANDVGMLKEILRRRFKNNWPKPDLILIDGGQGQVNAAGEILREFKLRIPIVGIAKGITRKKDELIFDKENSELARVAGQYKDILVAVRDEAHRFAITYHRQKRGRMW